MKIHHWVLLIFTLAVCTDIVVVLTYSFLRPVCPKGVQVGDVKREVHEVYPLLDK